MSNRDAILNELKSLDSSLPLANSPSFSVPEGYFENFAASVLAKVKNLQTADVKTELAGLSPLLARMPKAMPYAVPSSYFDDNLQNVLAGSAEETPLFFADLSKEMPYRVPVNYFGELPLQLLEKVSGPKAKVVPLFQRTWARAGAAAVIAGGLVIGSMQLFTAKTVNDGTASKQIDTASTLIAQVQPVIQQEIKKVSTEDLENFIQAAPTTASATPKKSTAKAKSSQSLKDVSINDLEAFLSDVPQTDEELFATDEP